MTPKMSPGLNKLGNKCEMCVRIFKWIPVVFIAGILVWSYYVFVYKLCFNIIESVPKQVFYLILYHGFLTMFVWSYWKTVFTSMGVVPRQFKLTPADAERIERETEIEVQRRIFDKYSKDLPILMRTMNGGFRYCSDCHHLKPDRAHHCSVCKGCILKMDHHCPWVNNCVGFTNYKFFVLFLGYGLLYCAFIASTTLEYFIQFWTGKHFEPYEFDDYVYQIEESSGTVSKELKSDVGHFHILFLFFVGLMFAISLGFLFGYHIYLTLLNRSTLESFRAPMFRFGPDKHGFSLGYTANFHEIFGANPKLWFLPIYTSLGDGVFFPTRTPQGSSYNSMGNTASQLTSLGEGVVYPEPVRNEDRNGLLNNGEVLDDDEERQNNRETTGQQPIKMKPIPPSDDNS